MFVAYTGALCCWKSQCAQKL